MTSHDRRHNNRRHDDGPSRVVVHVHIDHDHCSKALAAINAALKTFDHRLENLMSALDKITDAVALNHSGVASAISLLQGLKAALDAAITALPDTAALTALSETLQADDANLAAAVMANTPISTPPSSTPSTTVLTASANPVAMGGSVTLVATLTGSPMPTGTVSFLDGTASLGVGPLTNGSVSLDTSFATADPHNLTAEYSGDAVYRPSTSSAVDLVVTP